MNSLRPNHKDSSFESRYNLKNYVRIRVSLLKIRGIYRKKDWSHFKLNGWNIQSIFHWKWIGKNQFSILKNRIWNLLGILCIAHNIYCLYNLLKISYLKWSNFAWIFTILRIPLTLKTYLNWTLNELQFSNFVSLMT